MAPGRRNIRFGSLADAMRDAMASKDKSAAHRDWLSRQDRTRDCGRDGGTGVRSARAVTQESATVRSRDPQSHQPFHAELELPPADSARVVPIALKAVDRVALSALRELVGEVQPGLGSIVGIALVAGSATDPESIRNPHMRAHAREGQLFPHALATAAKTLRVPATSRSSNPKSSPVQPRNLGKRPTRSRSPLQN